MSKRVHVIHSERFSCHGSVDIGKCKLNGFDRRRFEMDAVKRFKILAGSFIIKIR